MVVALAGTSLSSMVMSADHPGLTFTLSLSQSEQTFHQPMQQWKFISDYAVSVDVQFCSVLQYTKWFTK